MAGATLARPELAAMTREEMAVIERKLVDAVHHSEFCYIYSNYPLDEAYRERWNPGSPHEQLTEELREEAFPSLLREVTGHSENRQRRRLCHAFRAGTFPLPPH